MAENVIRRDVVQVLFETNLDEMKKLNKGIDDIKKSILGVEKEDGIEKLKDQADQASKSTKKTADEMKKLGRTSLSQLNKGLQTAGKHLANMSKRVASFSFKALNVGLGAAATGVGVLAKQSVSAYADYEQLVGGMETLFKDSSPTVQKYANNAFKTAGLSANAYMDTVTSFSASLISSVGGDTKKAAEYGNMAILDMAD